MRAALAVAVAATGCMPGQNSVSGTVKGTSLMAYEALSYEGSGTDSGGTPFYTLGIVIDDFSGLCSAFEAGEEPAGMTALGIVIVKSEKGAILPTGNYVVGGADVMNATAQFEKYDVSCMPTLNAGDPTSGSVTIMGSDAMGVRGTFDLSWGSDRVTGTFSAPTCTWDASAAPICEVRRN